METINENRNEKYDIPSVGTSLKVEDRIKILANLIVDRIIESNERGVINLSEKVCTTKKMPSLP